MTDATARLIDAAERIVAEQGLGAMTARAVQEAAGQANKSAVQYHFGDRDGLIRAVVEARMARANDRRTSMLLALDDDPTLRELVEVYVLPLAESVESHEPSHWARFLLQAVNDPKIGVVAMDSVQSEAFRAVQRRLLARMDHVPEPLRPLRLGAALGFVCAALAAYEVAGPPDGVSADELNADLVDACVGLLTVPSTSRTPATT
ncbi:MAG: TetR/AcrR family transcriptional regulator [Acidimicrobiales bacterium]|nr:TetR/AcrR family transcriptional regulator [Acidimicrobiales bacterium]